MARFNVLGVNDDRDFCECCGRTNLKKVAWIEDSETGAIKHFGTICAAAPLKGFGVDKELKIAIKEFEQAVKFVWSCTHRKYRSTGGKYFGNAVDGWKADDLGKLNAIYAETLVSVRKNNALVKVPTAA